MLLLSLPPLLLLLLLLPPLPLEEGESLLLFDGDVHWRHCCCHHNPRSSQNLWIILAQLRDLFHSFFVTRGTEYSRGVELSEKALYILHRRSCSTHRPCTHSLLHCFGTSSIQYCPCHDHHTACSSSHFCTTTGLIREKAATVLSFAWPEDEGDL